MTRLFYRLTHSTLGAFAIGSLCVSNAYSATFIVSNLNDSGAGSFRQALTDANALAGTDDIDFAIVGTVVLLSPLPAITDQVNINGSTAPGYVVCAPPVFALNGAGSGAANGLQFLSGASGSLLDAINVQGFPLNGVQFIGSANCTVQACFIGTDLTGTVAIGNGLNGIQAEGGSNNNTFGGSTLCQGNLIAGNGGAGVSINGSTGNIVRGNSIGLSSTGVAAVPNGNAGILVINASNSTIIGGSLTAEANIISGNGTGLTGNGINIDGSSNCIIRGNYIGVDATGNVGLGNAENGIALNASPSTTIGGPGLTDGNTIADHNFHAIVINGASNNSIVQGNNCGTNVTGTAAIGNDDSGVIVINTTGTQIGGTGANEGNVFASSITEYGIFMIASSAATIEGNFIGTDRTGTINLGNFDGGIRFDFGGGASTIGGTTAGSGNTIAFNTGYGIGVLNAATSQVLISRNSIYCNTGSGIDLNGVGNTNEPSPVIAVADNTGCSGTASPNTTIEIFYDFVCGASCQGRTYVATVTANGVGNWSYVGALTGNVTATATDASNNTSEFANCIIFLPVEFGDFYGTKSYGKHLLNWSTISERDTSHFVIERSSDGLDWNHVGSVKAVGNSIETNYYSIIDTDPIEGMSYYRLLQFDLDGAMDQHEDIVRIEFKASDANDLVGVYNLLGQEIDPLTKGIQVHVFRDGTANKVVVD